MAASVFRRKKQGKHALARIQKLYDIVYNDAPNQGIRMICSEFVASCYEVAALRLNEAMGESIHPFGQGIDPRAMTAKAFEAVLHRSYSQFNFAGTYIGKTTMTKPQEVANKWHYHYETAKHVTNNPQLTPDQAYQWFTTDQNGKSLMWAENPMPSLAEFKHHLAVYRKFHPFG